MAQLSVYQLADEYALFTNRCIFLTGKAGTGKTTFLHNLQHKTHKQMVIAAPTGVAAINAGGTTLHSLFQLPFSPFIPTEEFRKQLVSGIKMRADRRKVLYELELLVIDEVSMVRADVLDAVDTLLRHFKYRHSEPFGGVQVLLIGDMFQLSPVVQDAEWQLLRAYYKGPYFFQSKVLQEVQPVYIELDTIYRQQNEKFVALLNQVRNNCLTDAGMEMLRERYMPDYRNGDEQDFHITLTTHNYLADKINTEELAKIQDITKTYQAVVSGEFQEKSYPTEATLELKAGAKVMFVKNDEQHPRRFYNGKIGMVVNWEDDAIVVESDGEEIRVERMVWKNIRYATDPQTKQLVEEELGRFTQFPLRLAWAITIHKSQGLTFDKVVIDAGKAFAPGQVYVALSRCRSLEGIVLLSPIGTGSLGCAPDILEYERSKPLPEDVECGLSGARRDYLGLLFSSVFDFRGVNGQIERLIAYVKENASQFNEQAVDYLIGIQGRLFALQEIGRKFRIQLGQIISGQDYQSHLQERMGAASQYFQSELKNLEDLIMQSPVHTDVRVHAKEYDDSMQTVFGTLAQKAALMKALGNDATLEAYYDARERFVMPPFRVKSYAALQEHLETSSEHPELLVRLARLRNKLAKEICAPVYLIGSTAMLVDISNRLPCTEKGLLRIKGFGKKKFERFGKQFLEIICDYVQEHDLEPMPEEPEIAAKPKRQKGDSSRQTLAMFRSGMTIGRIAEERGLALTTIVGHLFTFVRSHDLQLSDLLSVEKLRQAQDIVSRQLEPEEKFVLLQDNLAPDEYAVFVHWWRTQM